MQPRPEPAKLQSLAKSGTGDDFKAAREVKILAATEEETSPPTLETIQLPVVKPDYLTVADIKPIKLKEESKESESYAWIIDADSHGNFIDEAILELKKFEEAQGDKRDDKVKLKHPWIYRPNAETDQDLELAINGKLAEKSKGRTAEIVLKSFLTVGTWHATATKILDRGTLWTTKHYNSKQEIRFATEEPKVCTLAGNSHFWDQGFQMSILNDAEPKNRIIQCGNITIVSIPLGHIGVAKMNGNPVVLLPGRHAYNSPAFRMSFNKHGREVDILHAQTDLSSIQNEFNTLTIARILPKEIGIADDNGKPVILLPGTYIRNSTTFKLIHKLDALTLQPILPPGKAAEQKEQKRQSEDKVFNYKTLTIINVGFNEYACVQTKEGGKFLDRGTHVFNDGNTYFVKTVKQTDQNIEFANVQQVWIKGDELGLFTDRLSGKTIAKLNGVYTYDFYKYRFDGAKKLSDIKIEHGNYTRCIVRAGEIGVAWRGQNVLFLDPGIYEEYDPLFKFQASFDPTKQAIIQFGDKAYVTVKNGEARPVYRDGVREILTKTTVFTDEKNLVISPFTIPLNQLTPFDPPELEVQARDNIWFKVAPQIVYRIKDADKLMQQLGDFASKPYQHIEKRLQAVIRQNFMHYDSSMISPTKHAQALGEKESKDADRSMFSTDKQAEGLKHWSLESEITEVIKKELDEAGIEVVKFEFLSFHFKDQKMKTDAEQNTASIRAEERKLELKKAEAAVHYAEAQAKATRTNLEKRSDAETAKIEAELNGETAKITQQKAAEAEQKKVEIETARENAKKLADAKARADIAEQEAKATRAAFVVDVEKKNAEAKAAAGKIQWELEAKAIGTAKLVEAEMAKYKVPGYLELELAKTQLAIAQQQAQAPAPLFNFVGSGAQEAANSMLRGQRGLLQSVMKPGVVDAMMKMRGPYRQRRQSDPAVVADKKQDEMNAVSLKTQM